MGTMDCKWVGGAGNAIDTSDESSGIREMRNRVADLHPASLLGTGVAKERAHRWHPRMTAKRSDANGSPIGRRDCSYLRLGGGSV